MNLHTSGFILGTECNGPYLRNMVHLQGCTIGCPGCFNTHTWPKGTGEGTPVEEVFKVLTQVPEGWSLPLEGITISGGEPTEQLEGVVELLKLVRQTDLSVVMYTGLTSAELVLSGALQKLMEAETGRLVDLLVFGPYDKNEPFNPPQYGLVSSKGQGIMWLTDRYSPENLSSMENTIEVYCDEDSVTTTGFPSKGVIKSMKEALGGAQCQH